MRKQKVELVLWDDVRRDMKYPASDNNKGFVLGLNLLGNDNEIMDVQWFKTEAERAKFIKDNKLKATN